MKNSCKLVWSITAVVLLVALLYVNVSLLTSYKRDNSRNIEIMKVWWQENWNKIEKIYENQDYIDQQTQAIDDTIAQFSTESNNEMPTEWNADVANIVENLLATAPVRGSKDARFTIIEYTELLCPYCQRHSVDGTIQAVMDQFPWEVNSVSRHYIIHGQSALELAAAVECIAELKPDVYYNVFEKAFEAYPVDMDGLKNIATGLWVNWTDLQKCIDEWRYVQAVNDMMNQWATVFGISGTPGNVIYDRENGTYQVLPGAYPAENFVSMIESMK